MIHCRSTRKGLFKHIYEEDAQAIRALVKDGADINALDERGTPALIFASENDCRAVVGLLVELGARTDVKCRNGLYSPLMVAVIEGHVRMTRVLVGLGMDMEEKDAEGRTALHLAALLRRADVVRCLRKLGARVRTTDHKRSTPVATAMILGHRDMVLALVS
ncbi:unnamed protein product [Ectocarpus sp. 12 AP-2014]